MARLSKDEHEKILADLSNSINAAPEMMDLVQKLRDDFDESLSVDVEEVRREYDGRINDITAERDKARGERDEARRQYRERFFNGSFDARREAEEIVDRQKADSPKGVRSLLGIEG